MMPYAPEDQVLWLVTPRQVPDSIDSVGRLLAFDLNVGEQSPVDELARNPSRLPGGLESPSPGTRRCQSSYPVTQTQDSRKVAGPPCRAASASFCVCRIV